MGFMNRYEDEDFPLSLTKITEPLDGTLRDGLRRVVDDLFADAYKMTDDPVIVHASTDHTYLQKRYDWLMIKFISTHTFTIINAFVHPEESLVVATSHGFHNNLTPTYWIKKAEHETLQAEAESIVDYIKGLYIKSKQPETPRVYSGEYANKMLETKKALTAYRLNEPHIRLVYEYQTELQAKAVMPSSTWNAKEKLQWKTRQELREHLDEHLRHSDWVITNWGEFR